MCRSHGASDKSSSRSSGCDGCRTSATGGWSPSTSRCSASGRGTRFPNDAPTLAMDVIVGRALSTQTPVFDEEMREVIFRPYWNVPRSILRNEILPLLERDPDYLRRQDMEIVRGPGDNARPVEATAENLVLLRQGALRVRQRPGPHNALGLVKFVFPNEENVYMHGTPAQALFSRSRRDFSHGCVRVENPVALAEWALKEHPEWTRDRIVSAMAGTQSVHVSLPRPIQVILFYTTAVVMPEDGTIHFRRRHLPPRRKTRPGACPPESIPMNAR